MSRVMHVVAVVCLAALAAVRRPRAALSRRRRRSSPSLLVYEQSLVSEHDLSQVKRAFDLNGYVGILYFVATAAVDLCPLTVPRRGTFAVAITGASGALYAMRTMAALLERDCHLELVISDYGRRLLHDELGDGGVGRSPARLSGRRPTAKRRARGTFRC